MQQQLRFCDKLLGARIRAQKVMPCVNRLPSDKPKFWAGIQAEDGSLKEDLETCN